MRAALQRRQASAVRRSLLLCGVLAAVLVGLVFLWRSRPDVPPDHAASGVGIGLGLGDDAVLGTEERPYDDLRIDARARELVAVVRAPRAWRTDPTVTLAFLERVQTCRRDLLAEARREFGTTDGVTVRLEVDGRADPRPETLAVLAALLAGPVPLEVVGRDGSRHAAPVVDPVLPTVRAEVLGRRVRPVDLEQAPGVDDARYVDLVHRPDGAGTPVLVIAHARAWGKPEDEALRISQKVDRYQAYVTDGEFAARYPDAEGAIAIRLCCLDAPPPDLMLAFRRLREGLEADGIAFDVEVVSRSGVRRLALDVVTAPAAR